MKDIIKAITWGIALLFILLTVLFTFFFTILSPSNIYITSQRAEAHQKLAAEVMPRLNFLAEAYNLVPDNQKYMLSDNPKIVEAKKFVTERINACKESKECVYIYSTGLYDYPTIAEQRTLIERISKPESISSRNSSVVFSAICSFIAFLLSLYGLYALIRYKRLGAIGEGLFFALLTPPLGLALSLMFVNEYKSLQEYYTINDTAIGWAMFFIISPFLFYPPAIISARKNGIRIKNVLALKGNAT